MPEVQVNGVRIAYESHGAGDPLLLVMGLGAQLVVWPDDFVQMLVDRGFRVIRHDNRDVGLSEHLDHLGTPSLLDQAKVALLRRRPSDPPYLLSDMAADADGLLRELDLGPTHVVGASMGGMIAQTMAIEHPDTVRSLTSIMSNTGDRRKGLPSRRLLLKMARLQQPTRENAVEVGVEGWRLISGPHFDRERTADMVRTSVERGFHPDGTARQLMAIAASPDRTDDLGSVTAPTLVIHGLLDRLVKPSGGTATTKAVPGSRLLMLPDMAHDIPRPRWPEIVEAITDNARRAGATVSA